MSRPHDAQTPRVDAEIVQHDVAGVWQDYVHAALARQLELELQAERERGRRVREETIQECAKVCEAGEHEQDANLALEPSNAAMYHIRIGHVRDAAAIRALSRAESAPE